MSAPTARKQRRSAPGVVFGALTGVVFTLVYVGYVQRKPLVAAVKVASSPEGCPHCEPCTANQVAIPGASAAKGGGLPPIEYQPGAPAPTCKVVSYKELDPPECRDQFSHPFAGCLSEEYEMRTYADILSSRPIDELRCGFLDEKSRAWLKKVNADYAHCKNVVYTGLIHCTAI